MGPRNPCNSGNIFLKFCNKPFLYIPLFPTNKRQVDSYSTGNWASWGSGGGETQRLRPFGNDTWVLQVRVAQPKNATPLERDKNLKDVSELLFRMAAEAGLLITICSLHLFLSAWRSLWCNAL